MIRSRIHTTAYALSLLIAGAIAPGCATFEPSAAPRIEDYAPRPVEYIDADTPEPAERDTEAPPTAIKGLTVDTLRGNRSGEQPPAGSGC